MVNYINKAVGGLVISMYMAIYSVVTVAWVLITMVLAAITAFFNYCLARYTGAPLPYPADQLWIIATTLLSMFGLFLYTLGFMHGKGIAYTFYILLGGMFLYWFYSRAGWFLTLLLVIFLYWISWAIRTGLFIGLGAAFT